MKLAIMQPYLFPYIGYFQLITAVDVFVLYDDVQYVRRSWINRNSLLINGGRRYFTVPIERSSERRAIHETRVAKELYLTWRKKFLRTFELHYKTAPNFDEVFELITKTMTDSPSSVGELAIRSIQRCADYLGIATEFQTSSVDYPADGTSGVERILQICRQSDAEAYINAPGGRELYDKASFQLRGVRLAFLRPQFRPYPQPIEGFEPGLSILDVLMRCSRDDAREMVADFSLDFLD